MKPRILHPDFFSDSTVCALPFEARLLFAGLWCHADDYGRGRWLPKRIEGDIFPLDACDIDELLGLVEAAGLVVRYPDSEPSGQDEYYFIPTWERHQSPKYRAKSSIPPPPDENPCGSGPGQLGDNPGTILAGSGHVIGIGTVIGTGIGTTDASVEPNKRSGRERDPIWDTLVDLFGEPAKPHQALYGRVRKYLADQGADEAEIRRRASLLVGEWGPGKLTLASLEKHWSRWDGAAGRLGAGDVKAAKEAAEEARHRARAKGNTP